MNNEARIQEMTRRLTAEFAPSKLEIIDDSHLHVGHAGAKDGRGHFSLHIKANALEGKNRIAQHRLIYAALGDLMTTDIHALTIRVL